MPIQRYQNILVIKLVFYTYLHLTVPFSHGYFLDFPFECLYYLEGSLLPKLFIYCVIIIAHAQIKHYLMVSADLRFLTFLLSIQVCQLCSEIESKARNQMTLDLAVFFYELCIGDAEVVQKTSDRFLS